MAFKPLRIEDLSGYLQSTGPYELAPLEAELVDSVWGIERSVQSHPWSRALFEDCIGSRQSCLVIKHGDDIAGYLIVCAAAGNAELLNIAISPAFQRRGIARSALEHLITKLTGIADTLYLEVRESNTRAIALYDHIGFVEVGLRTGYYPANGGREDAVIMAYTLETE